MDSALDALSTAVAAVPDLPRPSGLGSADVLTDQVATLATAVAVLQRELAVRMAALEREGPPVSDARGDAVRAGVPSSQAASLRRLGVFAGHYPGLAKAWRSGGISTDQVAAVEHGAKKLATTPQRDQLVALVLPHLPNLALRETRRLIAATVDLIDPGDPDNEERRDHEQRSLVWSQFRGGIAFQGGTNPQHWTATVYPGPKGNFVFNASTIFWSQGLSSPPGHVLPWSHWSRPHGPDARVQQITHNLLQRALASS